MPEHLMNASGFDGFSTGRGNHYKSLRNIFTLRKGVFLSENSSAESALDAKVRQVARAILALPAELVEVAG